MTLRIYQMMRSVVNTVLGVVAFFLLLRVVFLFFSVNSATPFVSWILGASKILMSPFANLVPNYPVATGVLDITAMVTLFAYLLLGYIVLSIFESLSESRVMENSRASVHYHEMERDEDPGDHLHAHRSRRT